MGEGQLFTLLPSPQPRWKSFITGWSVQALSLVCVVYVGTRVHQEFVPLETYRVTNLVSYEPLALPEKQPIKSPVLARVKPAVESRPALQSKLPLESHPAVASFVVTPQVRAVPEHRVSEPEPTAPALKLDSKAPLIPAPPPPQIVALGTFSHDSPVTLPAARPAAALQGSSFGDSNGTGSGHGKGMGGANPNVVMSSGFGDGAISAFANPGIHAKGSSHQASTGSDAPVEITFKPKADYTDEGRKQKINGEVRLEVLFKSDGRIHVIRVLQGLGYGLDEQAVKAAEQIKFKPALHEGQPVDSTALVHIIFELIS